MADYDDEPMSDAEDEGESPDHQDYQEDDEHVQRDCLESFSSVDYIMEPGVFNQLKRYFKAGGAPEQVVELLPDNYHAVAQTANLLAEWLIHSGVNITEVQTMVENHLRDMIMKHFDPKKADSIFSDEGETPAWLAEMIDHQPWRELFYKLAEEYPDCLMLNFTIKLISDAGYQGEITTVSTACHQIEVFSRVLRTSITSFLSGGEDSMKNNLAEFTKMVCHGEHTYLYSQMLLHVLFQESKGGSNIKRLCQELQVAARKKNYDVTAITLALNGASKYPRAGQALSSMLSRNALNPADITVLYKMYSLSDPPPVDLIRAQQFLELLVDTIFKPGSRINKEHKSKYFYILAYASCVIETYKKGQRSRINKDDLQKTVAALEKAHTLCLENKGSHELIADVGMLFQSIKFPVVAQGVLKWIGYTVSDPSYFKLNTDHNPLHLVLLDEISNHILLHPLILSLLTQLFEKEFEEMDVLVQLELKKTVLDRMVHLLSRGCVLPVISYVAKMHERGDSDVSLIRHFVTEVLDVIAPPYTPDFVAIFLPLIENEDITGNLKNEENDTIGEFIMHCRTNS